MRINTRTNERGVALLAALVIVILIIGLIGSYLTVSTSNLKLTRTSFNVLQALYIAETGLARSYHKLAAGETDVFAENEAGDRVFAEAYTADVKGNTLAIGDFRVKYDEIRPGTLVRLVSAGTYQGITRTVEAYLSSRSCFDSSYAILAEGPIDLTGNYQVWGDVHTNGDADVCGNPDIYPAEPHISETVGNGHDRINVVVDQDLSAPPSGRPSAFQGNLSAAGDITATHNALGGVSGTVQPNADKVPIPEYDPQRIIDAAREEGVPVFEFDGDQHFSNDDNPISDGIIYVKGDVQITGNLDGNAMIIADGDITIAGNTQLGMASAGEPASLMLWAGDDINIGGATDIYGILFANDQVTVHGGNSLNIFGSVVSADRGGPFPDDHAHGERLGSTFHGSASIHYVRGNDNLTNLVRKWTLASWREVGEF